MDLIIFLTDKFSLKLLPSINKIVENQKNIGKSGIKYHTLKYESYEDIIDNLSIIKKKDYYDKITFIFLSIPIISPKQLRKLRENNALVCCFGDISQYYNYYYKFSQFLYDSLIVFEPEYKSFFEVYGTKTFSGDYFNHDILWILEFENQEIDFKKFKNRRYDFSFVGRLDREGRYKALKKIKNFFPNTLIYDSSKKQLKDSELKEILLNSKYCLNLTRGHKFDSYGLSKFPEKYLLQRKSRALAYAAAGCICFTEKLPQEKYYFESKSYLPLIEIPNFSKVDKFCYEYTLKNKSNLENIAYKFRESVYKELSIKKIKEYINSIHKETWNKRKLINKSFINKEEILKINNLHNELIELQLFRKEVITMKPKIRKIKTFKEFKEITLFLLKLTRYIKLFFNYKIKQFFHNLI